MRKKVGLGLGMAKCWLVLAMLCYTLTLKAGDTLNNTQLLNGQWEIGTERHYTGMAQVPGIPMDPTKMNEGKLWYRKELHLQQGDWKHAVLELKGARFLPEVYINGVLVSKQEGGMAPTFHLLDHQQVKPGNTITLEIALSSLKDVPETDASFIPPADQWRSNISSALWDDVVLHYYGDSRIENVIPFADLQKHSLLVRFNALSTDLVNKTAQVEVTGKDGKALLTKSQAVSASNEVSFNYGNALQTWSPEHPHVYRLKITILGKDGHIDDQLTMPLGIKQFGVQNKQFYLNNHPCKISGGTVVWHRWVRTAEGRKLGYDTAWFYNNIIRRLKEHGANYLRFHLGKPPEALLDLCDQYGLLVQYEWSFFHGMPASGQSLLKQYEQWLNIAARHPCVAIVHPYNETEGTQLDTVWKALNQLLPGYPSFALEDRDEIHVHKYWWSLFENLGLYYDSYEQFPKAVMVDEFGGNYLDENGNLGAYTTVKESYLRFLGREHTKEMRLYHQAQSCSKVAEYWRRIGAAGFAPFCIMSSNDDGNNWFLGDLQQGNPKPVWDELTAAWSPQSVSIDLWDRNFTPAQSISLPVYLFNDIDQPGNLHVKLSITDSTGKIRIEQFIDASLQPFSRQIKNIAIQLPGQPGTYNISAELVNRPANVKYPVISQWQVHVFSATIPQNLLATKIAIPGDESELQAFVQQLHIPLTGISDKEANIILTSVTTWNRIHKGDTTLLNTLQQAISSGRSVVMLDIGDRSLGQGYPAKKGDLGPLQGVARVTDPKTITDHLFGGITVAFREAAEPESHIHPGKNNNELWAHIPYDHTWLWNGMRAGLIVPAADMQFAGLNAAAFLAEWKAHGADENKIANDHYYAYELQGFYEYAATGNDETIKKKLKDRVAFLVQDAPALAMSVNPNSPVTITDLAKGYREAQNGIAENLLPLVNAGKNLTRTPVVMIDFGKNKGKLIASQLITKGRLAKGFGEEGLYGIHYDEVAVQLVVNMLSLSLQKTKP